MLSTAIIFIVILSLLVLVHEFGHFLTARRAGVAVEEFGFGFPPRLFGIKKGDTIYSINWIPLGGFVKIKGEAGEHRHDKDSFAGKSSPARAMILVAGVLMNFVLAWALLSVGYVVGLPEAIDGQRPYARVTDAKLQIVSVLKGSPSERAGIQTGDTVISVDGLPVSSVDNFRSYTAEHEGELVRMLIERKGRQAAKEVSPEFLKETGRPGVGVALIKTGFVSYPWYAAPIEAGRTVAFFTGEIFRALGGLVRGLFVEKRVTVEFSGPIGIAVITAEVAKAGLRHLLQFTALLSVNLAIVNVLPFPALDGGRLLFLGLERLRGRPVARKIEAFAHQIGFLLLMLLVVAITYRDVVRFGDKIWKSFRNAFGG